MSGKSSQLPHSCQICANKKRARCSPPYRPGVQLAHMCTLEATSRCCCGAGFSIGHMTKFFKAGSWKKSAPAQTSKTTTPLPDRVGRCWIRVASFTSLIHSAALVFLALQRTLSHIEDCLPMFNVADMSIGLVAIYNSKYCIGCDSHFNTTT